MKTTKELEESRQAYVNQIVMTMPIKLGAMLREYLTNAWDAAIACVPEKTGRRFPCEDNPSITCSNMFHEGPYLNPTSVDYAAYEVGKRLGAMHDFLLRVSDDMNRGFSEVVKAIEKEPAVTNTSDDDVVALPEGFFRPGEEVTFYSKASKTYREGQVVVVEKGTGHLFSDDPENPRLTCIRK